MSTITPSRTTKLAHRLLPVIRERRESMLESYAAAVEADRKMGYRPQTCIHGAYMWVDYDIPCGTCESEGRNWLPSIHQVAVSHAREALAECDRRYALIRPIMFDKERPDDDVLDKMIDWACCEPLRALLENYDLYGKSST